MKDSQGERLRRLVDEVLLHEKEATSVSNVFAHVAHRAASEGISLQTAAGRPDTASGAIILDYWWRLARVGIVAIAGAERSGISGPQDAIPSLHVSDWGRELIRKGSLSPHDPDRYLAELRGRLKAADEVAILYLSDAIRAWEAHLYRSSAVMLGCACERLIMRLAFVVVDKIVDSSTDRLRKKLADKFAPSVASVVEDLRTLLPTIGLPRPFLDGLDRKLVSIFEHVRVLRNKSGHPTGEDVPEEEARAGLLLFPGFCVFIDGVVAHLSP